MKKWTILALLLLVPLQMLALDKDKVFETLRKKFAKVESIAVEFYSTNYKKGNLLAKKGGRFRLQLGSRLIVSNGKEIWNYSVVEKKVVVQKVEVSNSISLDNFLLNFASDFEPVSFTRENSSQSGARNCLQVRYKPEPSHIIRIYLDERNEIREIVFSFGNNEESFVVKSLQINPKISNTQFNFKIPKGTEVIDLR
jgi:outer membrane lipoprotein-sorting protein